MVRQATHWATALFTCLFGASISLVHAQAAGGAAPGAAPSSTAAPANPSPAAANPAPAAANASTAAPKFEPVPGAIVNGLTGLVSATAGLKDYRSIRRTMIFRAALAQTLSPGLDVAKAISITPSNVLVLCSMRGEFAAIAAQTAYVVSTTNTLNQFATPPTIATIGDAFKSVFQSYTIDDTGQVAAVNPTAVTRNCQDDIDDWPASYYGAKLGPGGREAAALDLGADLSAFSALLSALNSIITPVITAGAQALDSAERAKKITGFLNTPKIQTSLISAATSLAKNASVAIKANRLQALGVFEEKLTAVRTLKIDLSKIEACKTALAVPPPAAPAGAAPAQPSEPAAAAAPPSPYANSDGRSTIPTDAFVSCYAQAWAQLNDAVTATITAAEQYDALADTPSDQLTSAVAAIQKNMSKLKEPNLTVDQLVDAATQLITVGNAVTTALSPNNIKTLQTDAQNVMNLFK